MMVDLQKKYKWALQTISYDTPDTWIRALKSAIIEPAIKKHNELGLIKAAEETLGKGFPGVDVW